MGKLAVVTDLHADINHLTIADLQRFRDYLEAQEVTHFHLAGDIANKVKTAVEVVDFFQQGLPTTFHWGNHEMADIGREQDFEDYNHQHFLNFSTVELSSSHVLLGVNGWYDYQFSDIKDANEILRLKNLFWYDRMIQRAGTDPEISQRVSERLGKVLTTIPTDKKIVVATHFVPKEEFIVQHTGKYQRWNHLNAFLGAKIFGETLEQFPAVEQVVFGHTHRRFGTQTIADIIYHCRPFGYYFEWQLTRAFVLDNQLAEVFNPTKMRGILRRNQPAFDRYKEQHVLDEFKRSVTMIDY
uniref:metallophosphoesterase n=1 Tax=Candidatus Enterococcus willemsii TaxID=1857215 RepID=UPI00403FA152